MSLKRILGTMLATRMGGRGRRRGSLGTAAVLGGVGRRRRSGLAGKAGLAALGYMAYKAYQDHQSRTSSGSGSGSGATHGSAAAGGSGSSGSLSGMVQDLVDRVTGDSSSRGTQQPHSADTGSTAEAAAAGGDEELREGAQAAESLSDDTALLLIRAMITAAYSDGAMSTDERERIMAEIDEAGGDAEDRAVMEREIANPRPLDELLTHVTDEETAEEFYLASRAAVDGDSEADRTYLAELRRRLNLSEEQVAEAEELAG